MSDPGREVEIHLTIHQENAETTVDFPFDTKKDDINSIVAELLQTGEFKIDDPEAAKAIISEQIANALMESEKNANSSQRVLANLNQSQIPQNIMNMQNTMYVNQSSFAPIDSDDSDVLNDPEYAQLLSQQKEELLNVERRHEAEQKELIAQLQKGTPSVPPPQTCDDLIIFG